MSLSVRNTVSLSRSGCVCSQTDCMNLSRSVVLLSFPFNLKSVSYRIVSAVLASLYSHHINVLLLCTQSFQESLKVAALAVVEKGPSSLQTLQSTYQQHFPAEPLSSIQKKFNGGNVAKNDAVASLVTATQDVTESILEDMVRVEQYIHLTIPKMEDGNNFGVTVQLTALKQITDSKDLLAKGLDELFKYSSARADALEKCKLPSQSTSTSTTQSESSSKGNTTEKGDATSTSTSTAKEEKTTESVQSSPDLELRKLAVTAVDLSYYCKAKSLFQSALIAYMASLDFMEKNSEKIALPKGEKGSGSAFSSMY